MNIGALIHDIEPFLRLTEVLAAVAIPVALFVGQTAVARNDATNALLREFHASEMSNARSSAECIARNYGSVFGTDGDLDPRIAPAEREPFFVVGRFFARLNVLRLSNSINAKRSCEIFAHHFAFWWELYLGKLHPDSSIKPDIDALHVWLFAQSERYRSSRERWSQFAEQGRRIAASGNRPIQA